jgi:hypothetical protein
MIVNFYFAFCNLQKTTIIFVFYLEAFWGDKGNIRVVLSFNNIKGKVKIPKRDGQNFECPKGKVK